MVGGPARLPGFLPGAIGDETLPGRPHIEKARTPAGTGALASRHGMATRATRIVYEQAKGIAEKVSRGKCARDQNASVPTRGGVFRKLEWRWMNAMPLTMDMGARPEAMADVPGVCELPLTRALVQYRDVHEVDIPGGRIQDIGLALVLDGKYATAAEVIDLGSASVKTLDLSHELVVLDWVYEPTLDYVNGLLRERAEAPHPGADALAPYCFQMALRLLERIGFGPLTRSTILRIGFRDICRDLDLHEGTSVRIVMAPGRITRAHLDYDSAAVVFRTSSTEPDPAMEAHLREAFPASRLWQVTPTVGEELVSYEARLSMPITLAESRATLGAVRAGLADLLSRFEPERFKAVEQQLGTFGVSETLARLRLREPRQRATPISAGADVPVASNTTVH